jgi:hypothetical protein
MKGAVFNMSSFDYLRIFRTERPVDSDWPVKKQDYLAGEDAGTKILDRFRYDRALTEALEEKSIYATQELYREAIILIESGKYKELRAQIAEEQKGKYSFFVCPFGNEEVDHNYEFVIKPTVERFQFAIERADEISHTGVITEEILRAITRSRFVVADLSDARPNCYYEVGYAHSLRKPVIILAKEDTERHFDISTYKWNFWKDYKDLKPTFEKELLAVLRDLGITTKGISK